MTYINSDVLPELNWASCLGASSLPSVSFLGTSMPAAGPFAVAAHPLPRVRDKVAVLASPAQRDTVTARLSQMNIHNYMTGVTAVGEGASGPPRDREPV